MKTSAIGFWAKMIIIFGLTIGLTACGGGGGGGGSKPPPPAPTPTPNPITQIKLSSTATAPIQIQPQKSVTITATLEDKNGKPSDPLNSIPITFTSTNTDNLTSTITIPTGQSSGTTILTNKNPPSQDKTDTITASATINGTTIKSNTLPLIVEAQKSNLQCAPPLNPTKAQRQPSYDKCYPYTVRNLNDKQTIYISISYSGPTEPDHGIYKSLPGAGLVYNFGLSHESSGWPRFFKWTATKTNNCVTTNDCLAIAPNTSLELCIPLLPATKTPLFSVDNPLNIPLNTNNLRMYFAYEPFPDIDSADGRPVWNTANYVYDKVEIANRAVNGGVTYTTSVDFIGIPLNIQYTALKDKNCVGIAANQACQTTMNETFYSDDPNAPKTFFPPTTSQEKYPNMISGYKMCTDQAKINTRYHVFNSVKEVLTTTAPKEIYKPTDESLSLYLAGNGDNDDIILRILRPNMVCPTASYPDTVRKGTFNTFLNLQKYLPITFYAGNDELSSESKITVNSVSSNAVGGYIIPLNKWCKNTGKDGCSKKITFKLNRIWAAPRDLDFFDFCSLVQATYPVFQPAVGTKSPQPLPQWEGPTSKNPFNWTWPEKYNELVLHSFPSNQYWLATQLASVGRIISTLSDRGQFNGTDIPSGGKFIPYASNPQNWFSRDITSTNYNMNWYDYAARQQAVYTSGGGLYGPYQAIYANPDADTYGGESSLTVTPQMFCNYSSERDCPKKGITITILPKGDPFTTKVLGNQKIHPLAK